MTSPDALESYLKSPRPLLLRSGVKSYEWGDPSFIPALLGAAADGKPHAELWLGAHPESPSRAVLGGAEVPLDQLIRLAPEALLGAETARRFQGRLPFLFKVLAAAKPLSIQAHPSKAQAEEGFARENAAGKDLKAPDRNYKDDNHKPELIAALTEFHGLRGFRPFKELAGLAQEAPELAPLLKGFSPSPGSLRVFYGTLMSPDRLPADKSDAVLNALLARLKKEDAAKPFTKADREYWVLAADRFFPKDKSGHKDRGLYAVYLLNLVHLKPGQAMYLGAGVLHAYLEGVGMEIMANSDNVLRGGLTPKHVDVPELLKTLTFEGAPAAVREGEALSPVESAYRRDGDVPEFALTRLSLPQGGECRPAEGHGAEIAVVLEADGAVSVEGSGAPLALKKGDAFFAPHGVPYVLKAAGRAVLYKAAVPGEAKPSFRGRTPPELAFGTSGLRGFVKDITNLEAYINARGFLKYAAERGLARPGDPVAVGADLRLSTDGPTTDGGEAWDGKGSAKGEILQAVLRAVADAGFLADYQGKIPTPALAFHALGNRRAAVMATGSHIPFDMNGMKFYRPDGEILKADEAGIRAAVAAVRREEYLKDPRTSIFDDAGRIKPEERRPLPAPSSQARDAYLRRYAEVFGGKLAGKRVIFYQHSAVGREILPEVLKAAGADVVAAGRSEVFIPIDTEDVKPETLAILQGLVDDEVKRSGKPVDAVVSTDGDSDRPLLTGVEGGKVVFFGGDVLGMVVAATLKADAAAVTNSANDEVERRLGDRVLPRTPIGSPFVIQAMNDAAASGRYKRIVAWESNGGFLTGSDIELDGKVLKALPTRDAALPLLAALAAAGKGPVGDLFKGFSRFTKAGLLKNVPRAAANGAVARFSPKDADVLEASFAGGAVKVSFKSARPAEEWPASDPRAAQFLGLRDALAMHFPPADGFAGGIVRLNFRDAVKVWFGNGDVAYFRASGNADEFRIYANADTPERAEAIVRLGVADNGILRRLIAA